MTIGSKNNTKKCGYCASTELVTDQDTGETICKRCAVVTSNDNTTSDEGFISDVSELRTGAPSTLTMHDMGYQQR